MAGMSVKDTIRGLLDCSMVTDYREIPDVDVIATSAYGATSAMFVAGASEVRVTVELLVVDDAAARRLIPGVYDTLDRMIRVLNEPPGSV